MQQPVGRKAIDTAVWITIGKDHRQNHTDGDNGAHWDVHSYPPI